MSEEKRGTSLATQIIVPVVVALLVGGTAPWWWSAVIDGKRETGGAAKSASAPGAGRGTPVVQQPGDESPEAKSRTKFGLLGDEITFFRVGERNGRQLRIEVDYKYNEQHGTRVMAGAWLKGVESGYKPVAFVPSAGQGTVQVDVTVSKPGTSTGIDIFLYEYGKAGQPFARRSFPFANTFE